jgi:hypothetical protein
MNSKNYETVISYEDLIGYYESELFKFYENNQNVLMPDLVTLLNDYLKNIYIYRTKVGFVLHWKLPQF